MRAAGAVLIFLCVLGFSSFPRKLSSLFKHQTDKRPAFSRSFSSDLQSQNLPYPGYLLFPSTMAPMVLSRRTKVSYSHTHDRMKGPPKYHVPTHNTHTHNT